MEMRIKGDAPLLSRSPSPERKYVRTLPGIPEAIPGPNAFAQQAARQDQHRLEGNAFYQQEVQKRSITPPTVVHPALRHSRSSSEPPSPPRHSTCTTMSPFINADKPRRQGLPALKLLPPDADLAQPTKRGQIEERFEQREHEQRGDKEERIPVFIPTPKIACSDFADPSTTPKTRVGKEPSLSNVSSKTPKRGFLGRLKLTTNLRGISSPSTATLNSLAQSEVSDNVPVKAQAAPGASPSKGRNKGRTSLGSSTSRTSIPTSPTKRKGFFSRKSSGLAETSATDNSYTRKSMDAVRQPLSASTVAKTPPTAFSDPTHYSYQSQRIISKSHPNKGGEEVKQAHNCAITRSQSLKYFDHVIPPTPPAKNTPPDEKAKKEVAESSRLPFHDEQTTPSKEPTGIVSTNGRISPTRFGSYGHREIATLVTRPSMYSLHASVVPDMTEASTFEEMKARMDGLGLEGFSTPMENVRGSKFEKVYSPSMYSTEWATRPNSVVITPKPEVKQAARESKTASSHTKDSSSSGGEIPVCYPELAKDPSLNNMATLQGNKKPADDSIYPDHERLEASLPWHGRTHSRDHSSSPRHSVDSTIFAHHVDNDLKEPCYDSPTSFKQASATPSPLHLPTHVYAPPPRKSSRLRVTEVEIKKTRGRSGIRTEHERSAGLGIEDAARPASTPPMPSNGVFDNVPTLPALVNHTPRRTPTPQTTFRTGSVDREVDVDPQKPSPHKSPSTEKLDRMIAMLNMIHSRNNEISSMRDEMRATNVRLDQRLAAVENLQRASPAPSSVSIQSSVGEEEAATPRDIRVPTNVAHDFYRSVRAEEDSASQDALEAEHSESETIAELKETNRRLLEMVGGFAEKIQALEKKVGGPV